MTMRFQGRENRDRKAAELKPHHYSAGRACEAQEKPTVVDAALDLLEAWARAEVARQEADDA